MDVETVIKLVQPYDVVQINIKGKWMDYSTIRDKDIRYCVGMVKYHPSTYRIVSADKTRIIVG